MEGAELSVAGMRPWRELAASGWSPPANRTEAYDRTSKNATRFRSNYIAITAAGTLVGLVAHPMALVAVCAVCAVCGAADACAALFNMRPLSLAERCAFVGGTSVLGLFFFSDAGAVMLSSGFVASVACLVHAACKTPQADPV